LQDVLEVNAVISAVGMLNRPSIPKIEGIEDPWVHSSRWDHTPWRLLDYWKMTAEPDLTDYLLTTSPNPETRLVGA